MVQTIYHVGLPRTATTFMQKNLFPNLPGIRFLGKTHDNTVLRELESGGIGGAPQALRACLRSFDSDRERDAIYLRAIFTTIVKSIRIANGKQDKILSRKALRAWKECLLEMHGFWPAEDLLISDESFLVSHADFATSPAGDTQIVLEQFAKAGFLKDATVCVTIRSPIDFIKASYYKQNHQRFVQKHPPVSFHDYIRVQLAIYLRYPPASRLFLAMSKRLVPHLKNYCGSVLVSRFDELVKAERPADTLLGRRFPGEGRALSDARTENATFSDDDVNAFVLSAPGVPKSITLEQYAATFPQTLKHYFLDKLLEDEQWTG